MLNQDVYDKVTAAFEAKFGSKPAAVAYAPGRIEVLGNQDRKSTRLNSSHAR